MGRQRPGRHWESTRGARARRAFWLLVDGERIKDDAAVEHRMLAGISHRLK
jgi:hypothetical protein